MDMVFSLVPDLLVLVSLVCIALGRVGPFRTNRAGIALAGASLLWAWTWIARGSAGTEILLGRIDGTTLILLVCMMMVTANLRLSGFFGLAGGLLSGVLDRPRRFLALVILVSALCSALFINDTAVIMLSPLVLALCLPARADPVPHLLGLALGANIGSAATLIGNPQNIVIAGLSGLQFGRFTLVMLPPVLAGLILAWGVVTLLFRVPRRSGSFAGEGRPDLPETASGMADASGPASSPESLRSHPEVRPRIYRPLLVKSLVATALFLASLLAGVPPALGASCATALLLVTRRLSPDRIFSGVDWTLPVFFAGLFVITGAARDTLTFRWMQGLLEPLFARGAWESAGVITVLSQVISNVPAVLLLAPLAGGSPSPEKTWMLLSAVSTLAGNLTLLGSVANLIVAESALARGVRLGFLDFLKAGLPVGLATIAMATAWLAWVLP